MWPHQWAIYLSLAFLAGNLFATRVPAAPGIYIAIGASLLVLLAGATERLPRYVIVGLILVCVGGLRYADATADWRGRFERFGAGKLVAELSIESLVSERGRVELVARHVASGARLQLYSWDNAQLEVGDRITGSMTISKPNPTSYDLAHNIHGRGQLNEILAVNKTAGFHLHRTLAAAQTHLANMIDSAVPAETGSLIKGLLLGIRSSLGNEFREQLARSGTTHIVALSGFNITLVIVFLGLMLGFMPRPVRLVVSGLAVLAFIIMTGLAASVVRAAVMGWLLLLSGLWGRKVHLGSALALAAASMVAVHPLILSYDVGFQLSVLATAGLLVLAPPIQTLMPAVIRRLPLDISGIIAATLAATAATLPVTTYYFGGLSVVSVISNALIVPIVPFAMLGGAVGVALAQLTSWANPILFIFWLPARAIIWLVEYWGTQPYSFIETNFFSPILLVGWYAVLVVISLRYAHLGSYVVTSAADGRHANS